jgi:hypothetical protein
VLTGGAGSLEVVVGELEGVLGGAQRGGAGAGQSDVGRWGFAAGDRGAAGDHRRTGRRLAAAETLPIYERAASDSMLDPLERVLARLLVEWPAIKAPRVTEILRDDYDYAGSVDLVRKRMAVMRPREVRPAQRTGYRPGPLLQVDWAQMPTRPKIAGRERRVYALICSLPFSGASTAHLSFDMTIESLLEGHVRALGWLGGVPRECVYHNLRSVVARRDGDAITWNARFLHPTPLRWIARSLLMSI